MDAQDDEKTVMDIRRCAYSATPRVCQREIDDGLLYADHNDFLSSQG
jgi:hypothetical protein